MKDWFPNHSQRSKKSVFPAEKCSKTEIKLPNSGGTSKPEIIVSEYGTRIKIFTMKSRQEPFLQILVFRIIPTHKKALSCHSGRESLTVFSDDPTGSVQSKMRHSVRWESQVPAVTTKPLSAERFPRPNCS